MAQGETKQNKEGRGRGKKYRSQQRKVRERRDKKRKQRKGKKTNSKGWAGVRGSIENSEDKGRRERKVEENGDILE
jgi:hypothetical protein